LKNEKEIQKDFEEEMAKRQSLTDQISVQVHNSIEEIPSNYIHESQTELQTSSS